MENRLLPKSMSRPINRILERIQIEWLIQNSDICLYSRDIESHILTFSQYAIKGKSDQENLDGFEISVESYASVPIFM